MKLETLLMMFDILKQQDQTGMKISGNLYYQSPSASNSFHFNEQIGQFRLLKLASDLNDSSIRLQDTPITFGSVSVGDVGRLIIFDYFQNNWPQLYSE